VDSADAICFTSSSTVTGFPDVYGPSAVPPIAVSIGPVTLSPLSGPEWWSRQLSKRTTLIVSCEHWNPLSVA
jgi:hypothetical protein